MDEKENEVKVTKPLIVRGKRILLQSGDSHMMWLDILETGTMVLHEMFGVPSAEPASLEDAARADNSCYHVTIAIKKKYVGPLLDALKSDGLFSFDEKKPEPPSDVTPD